LTRRAIASLIAALVACWYLAPATTNADAETAARKKKAAEYFARGELLFESEEYGKAAAAFTLEYENAPHPSVLANIALSHERAGELPQAVDYWERYLEAIEDESERAQVEARLSRLRRQVGELTVECPRAACRIHIDGIERGEAPLTVILSAGVHRIEAYAGDQKLAALDTRVEGEEQARVELFAQQQPETAEPAGPPEETAPAAPPPADEGEMPLGPGFWISSAVAVVAGGCVVAFGVKTLKDEDEFNASGRADEDLQEQGERDKLLTNVMIGVTAAAAATAVGFAIYDLTRDPESASADDGPEVALGAGPGLGLGLTGSF
jgi:tetratricopeptide (TPR) repeat protein